MTRADGFIMRRLVAGDRLTAKQEKRAPKLRRWLAFKDEVRIRHVRLPDTNAHVIFLLPMPASWSQKRKDKMRGYPHRGKKDGARKNDVDNLTKALLDAVYGEDSGVWDIRGTKFWWDSGGLYVIENEGVRISVPFDHSYWMRASKTVRASTVRAGQNGGGLRVSPS